MGYTTDFSGQLRFDREVSEDDKKFLDKLASTRRMGRNVGPEYGVEGEFYVDGGLNDYNDPTVIDHNREPKTQPGLWLQWVVTEDRRGLEWDGGEKFYSYVEWLEYLINRVFPFLSERSGEPVYVLNGEVEWFGEDSGDTGVIVVKDNVVSTRAQGNDGEDATRLFFVTDSHEDNEEIFETLEDAEMHIKNEMDEGSGRRLRICLVNNAYREADGSWNYDDLSNTFETVKELTDWQED